MGTRTTADGVGSAWALALRSLVLFVGTLSGAIAYLLSPLSRPFRTALENVLAETSGAFLRLFEPTVTVTGSLVSIRGFVADIVPACTGIFTTSIFVAAVLAFPCSFRRKLYGTLLGVLGILAFNWIRIVSLLAIGAYAPQALDVMHLVVWRSLAIFFALLLWLGWVRGVGARHAAPA